MKNEMKAPIAIITIILSISMLLLSSATVQAKKPSPVPFSDEFTSRNLNNGWVITDPAETLHLV